MFKVKVEKDRGMYYLGVTHNGYQWSNLSLYNAEQMLEIARTLTSKAEEILMEDVEVIDLRGSESDL